MASGNLTWPAFSARWLLALLSAAAATPTAAACAVGTPVLCHPLWVLPFVCGAPQRSFTTPTANATAAPPSVNIACACLAHTAITHNSIATMRSSRLRRLLWATSFVMSWHSRLLHFVHLHAQWCCNGPCFAARPCFTTPCTPCLDRLVASRFKHG